MSKSIRAIVFKDSDRYVAQCLEHDVAVQADSIDALFLRLDRTVQAEMAMRTERGEDGLKGIPQAPAYYHGLWEDRAMKLDRVQVDAEQCATRFDYRLATAA